VSANIGLVFASIYLSYISSSYVENRIRCYCVYFSYTHDIEAVSCDEMFVDCVDLINDTGASCLDFATLLRKDIYKRTGCTASVGIGA